MRRILIKDVSDMSTYLLSKEISEAMTVMEIVS